jgi:hypothetical protein
MIQFKYLGAYLIIIFNLAGMGFLAWYQYHLIETQGFSLGRLLKTVGYMACGAGFIFLVVASMTSIGQKIHQSRPLLFSIWAVIAIFAALAIFSR